MTERSPMPMVDVGGNIGRQIILRAILRAVWTPNTVEASYVKAIFMEPSNNQIMGETDPKLANLCHQMKHPVLRQGYA